MIPVNADLEQKIVDAIYRGACDPAELRRAIELIGQYFDSSGVVFGELDHAAPEVQFTLGVRTVDQAFLADYLAYSQLDPAPRAFSALSVGTASTSDRVFSQEVLRTDVFLNEFLRPRGVDASLASPLLATGGRIAIVAVHQGTNRSRYGDDAIARLERLTPHLTRALQIRRLFLRIELRSQALEATVNRNTTGMIGLAREGPALFVNDAARAIARARDGISLDRHGRTRGGGPDGSEAHCGARSRCRARRRRRHRTNPAFFGPLAVHRVGFAAADGRRHSPTNAGWRSFCDPRSEPEACLRSTTDCAPAPCAARSRQDRGCHPPGNRTERLCGSRGDFDEHR